MIVYINQSSDEYSVSFRQNMTGNVFRLLTLFANSPVDNMT